MRKPRSTTQDELLTFAEAARLLGRSRKTVQRLVQWGALRAIPSSGGALVSRRHLRAAKVLTASGVARLARCSVTTVRRRVQAGLLVPGESLFPTARFSLRDASLLRRSLQR